MSQIPKTVKGVFLEEFGKPTTVKEVELPELQLGELLVQVEAAPINPADILFLNGYYSTDKKPPTIAGMEGSGIIIAGKGEQEEKLVGKRVSFLPKVGVTGTYGEYAITNAAQIILLPDNISYDEAASTFVNPLTIALMFKLAEKSGVKAVIHTAAASQVGRMMVKYFQKRGIQVINVVRRQEQVEILKKLGAEHILNQTDSDFEQKLKTLAAQLGATIAFEAVGGSFTSIILSAMPNSSTLYLYGALSGEGPNGVGIGDLIFQDKSLKGFWLTPQLLSYSVPQQIEIVSGLTSLLTTDFKTEISKRFTFEQFAEALEYYSKNMSAGKVLIKKKI